MPPKGTGRKTADNNDDHGQETHDEIPQTGRVAETVNQFEAHGGGPNSLENAGLQTLLERLISHEIESERRI
ncbi:hypothetical protein M5689_007140 [Euphorbia peplus]|nr:hypothetical protein M5689_007140 [Euphorbia peplus]